MAKLHARGRTEKFRMHKQDLSRHNEVEYAFMSDDKILKRSRLLGSKWSPWNVVSILSLDGQTAEQRLLAIGFAKKGVSDAVAATA